MRGIAAFLIFVSSVASAQITTRKLGELESSNRGGAGVAISPKSNKNIVVYAARKVQYSNDAGATWGTSTLEMPSDLAETPKVVADSKGNFFLVYSIGNDLVVRNSGDDGKTWSEVVPVAPTPNKKQYNPGIVAHPKKEQLIVTWTEVDTGGIADSCKSNIMLSTSGNGGKKWSKPVQINQNSGNCLDEDFTLRGSNPIIGLDGKAFVVWAGQGILFYDRSYDGNMWLGTDLGITEQAGGWTITIPGFGKVANTPVAVVENSPSRIQGTLFLVYSDLKSGDKDSDVWLARSVSRGDNWTVPARINQDKPGRDQFMPRICIDPASGHVYILYYDRRDYTDNQTDVYLAWSVDGGNQFKEKKLNQAPFVADLDAADYMTDYIGITAQKGVIVPVWTAVQGGKQEVWTAVIKQEDLKEAPKETPKEEPKKNDEK